MNKTQLQYQSVINTANLWDKSSPTFFHIKQLNLIPKKIRALNFEDHLNNIKLGHKVEYFLNYFLSKECGYNLLFNNIQINNNSNETIGELDALVEIDNVVYHLEYSYKFYLLDDSLNLPQIKRWVGPNQKDSLYEKLLKLHNKQFPLLYQNETKLFLSQKKIDFQSIKQRTIFKAQLFIPFHNDNLDLKEFNPDVISGIHLTYEQLSNYKTCKFFIPSKHDWLIPVQTNVSWVNFESICLEIIRFHNIQLSPMVWIKFQSGKKIKCFVRWW